MTDDLFVHGGALDRMRQAVPQVPEPWLDLCTGINPWPYPTQRLPGELLHRLPTRDAHESCRASMAAAFGAEAKRILVTPETELVIRLLPMLLPEVRTVAVRTPGDSDHAEA